VAITIKVCIKLSEFVGQVNNEFTLHAHLAPGHRTYIRYGAHGYTVAKKEYTAI
jgi:hypothetical protein